MPVEYEYHIQEEDLTSHQINGWQLNVAEQPLHLDPEVIQQERELLQQWQQAFVHEDTWVQREVGVPSLIVRFDGTINDGERKVWEVEERPGWIGLSSVLNADFAGRFADVQRTWPQPITAVLTPDARTLDDHLWTKTTDTASDAPYVLLRSEPTTPDIAIYVANAISTVRTEGDKSYGEKMNLWSAVDTQESLDATLDTGERVVFKPKQGSKLKDLRIWIPTPLELKDGVRVTKNTQGAATRKKINETFATNSEGMYAQPFHPPMVGKIGEKDVYIGQRSYWAYDLKAGEYVPLGGLSMARRNVLIHGASDAVLTPLKLGS